MIDKGNVVEVMSGLVLLRGIRHECEHLYQAVLLKLCNNRDMMDFAFSSLITKPTTCNYQEPSQPLDSVPDTQEKAVQSNDLGHEEGPPLENLDGQVGKVSEARSRSRSPSGGVRSCVPEHAGVPGMTPEHGTDGCNPEVEIASNDNTDDDEVKETDFGHAGHAASHHASAPSTLALPNSTNEVHWSRRSMPKGRKKSRA